MSVSRKTAKRAIRRASRRITDAVAGPATPTSTVGGFRSFFGLFFGGLAGAIAVMLFTSQASAIDFPIVYVRQPITSAHPRINDIEKPCWTEPGSALMLLKPDGTEEVLFADPVGGVLDPCPSLDAKWVYYSYTVDARDATSSAPVAPTDIYKINIATREIVQLTHSEVTRVSTDPMLSQQPHNLGACPIPGGRVIFESSRNMLRAPRDKNTRFYWQPTLQLYVMDEDGKNVEQVGYMNLGGTRHPTLLKDGRIMWSSGESHGLRNQKLWGLWASKPDGRTWEPLWSGFDSAMALSSLHGQSQSPDGRLQLVYYYPVNQSGYGNLFDFQFGTGFGSPPSSGNETIADRMIPNLRFGFQPRGIPLGKPTRSLTPFATGADIGGWHVAHSSGAPGGLLVSLGRTAVDPVTQRTVRLREASLAFIPGPEPQSQPTDLVVIPTAAGYFANQPKALVPYSQIYGQDAPQIADTPNPTSTPFGWVGSSGVYARESKHANRTDRENVNAPNLWGQGGDVGEFNNSDIESIRFLVQRPTPKDQIDENKTWTVTGLERMAVLGEIQVHKRDAAGTLIRDSAGDPDTSFLARIPADHSFTFQLIDKYGQVLSHSMTWHQVRPGETRTDCRGCHAHNQPGIVFDGTAASQPTYTIADLTAKPVSVEWTRDILPILTKHCGECHGANNAEGLPNLLDPAIRDSAQVRPFRARLSMLMARVLSDDPATRMPRGKPALSAADIKTLATWIDLGAARDNGTYYQDNQRPVLFLNSPRRRQPEVTQIQFGAFELDGTIAATSVKASWSVNGRPAGIELFDLFTESANIWALTLSEPVENGVLTVSVTDSAGRVAKIDRSFSAGDSVVEPPPAPNKDSRIIELEMALQKIKDTASDAIKK